MKTSFVKILTDPDKRWQQNAPLFPISRFWDGESNVYVSCKENKLNPISTLLTPKTIHLAGNVIKRIPKIGQLLKMESPEITEQRKAGKNQCLNTLKKIHLFSVSFSLHWVNNLMKPVVLSGPD